MPTEMGRSPIGDQWTAAARTPEESTCLKNLTQYRRARWVLASILANTQSCGLSGHSTRTSGSHGYPVSSFCDIRASLPCSVLHCHNTTWPSETICHICPNFITAPSPSVLRLPTVFRHRSPPVYASEDNTPGAIGPQALQNASLPCTLPLTNTAAPP